MIKIVVLPTVDPTKSEDELPGIPLEDLEQFVGECKAMVADSMDGKVLITIHGKDLRGTCITQPVNRRGIGNNRP